MSILRTEHLSRNFGGLMAVNNVNIAVEPGERRAIIGPNGAGKTTFFNLLSGELRPLSGRIFLDEQDITPLPVYERARLGIGRTFQRNNLFLGLTVYENVQLALQQRLGIASRWFQAADAFDELKQEALDLLTALDLEERLFQPAGSLSYGEQRQLEIALALAMKPRVLLLDEPTAGMSPAETAAMVQMIENLPRDVTLLIIEHDMDVVFSLADRITVLHYGEVIAEGTPEEVKNNPRVLEVYLGEA